MSASSPKNFTVWLSVFASQATLLFSFGYKISILLLTATTVMEQDLKLTEHQLAHFTVDAQWALFLACLASGFMADFIGRRSTLIVSGALSFLGFLFMAVSNSYALLITGRVVSLAGLGLGLPVTPLYIGEISSFRHRGRLNTIPEIFSVLGLWLAVMMRGAVGGLSASLQWRMLVGVGVVPSLILGVGMIFMPESPCWLIMRGRVADTKIALEQTLKTTPEVSERLSALRSAARVPPLAMEAVVEVPPNRHVLAIWREIICPRSLVTTVVKAVVSISTLHFIQQATGIDLLTLEAMAKFGLQLPTVASVELVWGLTPFLLGRLLPIFVPLFLSDTFKRKTILSASLMLTGISLVAVNVSLVASRQNFYAMNPTAAARMNKWTTVAYLGSFSLGVGPITWVHTSEMLPFKVRAQVIGIVVTLNRLISFCLTYLKPIIDRQPNMIVDGLMYWILNILFIIGMSLYGQFFIESKGRSLEELDELPRDSTIELT